ncbi:hypothetical protein CERSUDRAFT_71895 [Gelatoporia subvermispora B]|uniref:Uncharacterized protein n=1 Tax=Ceriporiopsis subvermispora (strain B) TaxID=914234 RepID=M2RNT2_CERS8|nr:hypothetical protein CERSUDRAFT_71895 [Gelatoporia subvermispora B]
MAAFAMNHLLAISSSIFTKHNAQGDIIKATISPVGTLGVHSLSIGHDGKYEITNASKGRNPGRATPGHTPYPRRNSASSITSNTSYGSFSSQQSSHTSSFSSNQSTSPTSSPATNGSRLSWWSTRYRCTLANDNEAPDLRYDNQKDSGPSWAKKVGGWSVPVQGSYPGSDPEDIDEDDTFADDEVDDENNIAVSCANALLDDEDEDSAPVVWRRVRGRIPTPAPQKTRLSVLQGKDDEDDNDESYLELEDDDVDQDAEEAVVSEGSETRDVQVGESRSRGSLISVGDERRDVKTITGSVDTDLLLDPITLSLPTLPPQFKLNASSWAADFDAVPYAEGQHGRAPLVSGGSYSPPHEDRAV